MTVHYLACWRKFLDFSGRASRAEFWRWALANAALFLIFSLSLQLVFGPGKPLPPIQVPFIVLTIVVVGQIYLLLAVFPTISVVVRRLHDQDLSGWWGLVGVALPPLLLIMLTVVGTEGPNRFGPPPWGPGDGPPRPLPGP